MKSGKVRIEPEDDGGVAAKGGAVHSWYRRQADEADKRSKSRGREKASVDE